MTWTDITLQDGSREVSIDFREIGGSVELCVEGEGFYCDCHLSDEQVARLGSFFGHLMERR